MLGPIRLWDHFQIPQSPNSLRLVDPKSDSGGPGQQCCLRLPGWWCPLQSSQTGGGGNVSHHVSNWSPEVGVVTGFPPGFSRRHLILHSSHSFPVFESFSLPLFYFPKSLWKPKLAHPLTPAAGSESPPAPPLPGTCRPQSPHSTHWQRSDPAVGLENECLQP